MQQTKLDKQMPKKPPLNSFVIYSSMAFQMGIIIFGSAYGGVKLDEYTKAHGYIMAEFPIFTLTFTILGVAIAMYLFLKDLFKHTK